MHFLLHQRVNPNVRFACDGEIWIFIFHEAAPEKSFWRALSSRGIERTAREFHLIPTNVSEFKGGFPALPSLAAIGIDGYLTLSGNQVCKRHHAGRRTGAIRKKAAPIANLAWRIARGAGVPVKQEFRLRFLNEIKAPQQTGGSPAPQGISDIRATCDQEEPVSFDDNESSHPDMDRPPEEVSTTDEGLGDEPTGDHREAASTPIPQAEHRTSLDETSETRDEPNDGLDPVMRAPCNDILKELFTRDLLRDDLWEECKRCIRRGVQRKGQELRDKQWLSGILVKMVKKCDWRDVPKKFGGWNSLYRRYNRWWKDGTLGRIVDHLNSKGFGLDIGSIKKHAKCENAKHRPTVSQLNEQVQELRGEVQELREKIADTERFIESRRNTAESAD